MSESSLVIQTSFLGDVVLTTPLLAHLAESGPVDVVCTPAASPLLANHPAVRERIVYDKRRSRSRRPRLSPHGVGVAIATLPRRLSGAGIGAQRRTRVRRRASPIGSGFRPRPAARSTRPGSPRRRTFITRARLLSARRRGTRCERSPMTAFGHASTRAPPSGREVEALLEAQRAGGDQLIAVAPGSVWATKRWPGFPGLAHTLGTDHRIVVIGGRLRIGTWRPRSWQRLRGARVDATGRLSLLASAELIRRSALLVTNDSLPLHLASAMNTPTVAVFGPTVPEFGFGPLATSSAVAGLSELACRPCDRHGPRRVPPRTLALYARDYTNDGCIAGARAPARRPRSLSSHLVIHAHEEATPLHRWR